MSRPTHSVVPDRCTVNGDVITINFKPGEQRTVNLIECFRAEAREAVLARWRVNSWETEEQRVYHLNKMSDAAIYALAFKK